MAHANPEFVLGLRAVHDFADQLQPGRFNLNAARAALHRLATIDPADRTPTEHALVCRYRASMRQTRIVEAMQRETAQDRNRGPGQHGGGKAGERFVEPKRRWPQDVQKHGV